MPKESGQIAENLNNDLYLASNPSGDSDPFMIRSKPALRHKVGFVEIVPFWAEMVKV